MNVRVEQNAPWSAHLANAFDVVRKPANIQTQLDTPPPLVPQSPSQCREKWVAQHRAAVHAIPNDSPQEMVVSGLRGSALSDSVVLSLCFFQMVLLFLSVTM